MERNDISKEKMKLSDSMKNINKELFNLRIEAKLSLRKRELNNFFYNKRLFGNNSSNTSQNKIAWKLLYNENNIKFNSDDSRIKYNLNVNDYDDEKILSLASKYLKSGNIDDIKYGIFMTQIFIKRNMDKELTNSINLLFIYELFHIIDKINKQIDIIFNIFDIIINYSSINTDKNLATILLSPESYRIWGLCFNLQNFDIFYEIISIFNNIIQDNPIGSFNLIRSDFLRNNIFNFYMNQTIISQKVNEDKNNVYYNIIKDGINLLCSLLIVTTDNLDSITRREVISSKEKIINILLIYSNTNSFDNYYKCIYSIENAIKYDPILFDELERNNFIENILINKNFFDEKRLLYILNRIFGDYIAYKNNINNKLLVEIINFEAEYLANCKESSYRKEIFWSLSNVLLSDDKIYEKIFENESLLSNIFECFKNSYSFQEIREILYFFSILFTYINNKYFIELEKNHLLELVFYHSKNLCENRVDGLLICFQIFEFYLMFGNMMSKYFEGRNIIKEKFDKLGGKELLEEYLNYPDDNLVKKVGFIFENFYQA